jgi:preprotein translocase subunit YajC
MNKQTKTTNNMKKFFKVLLLAAVALMPVMGMAQTENERDYAWEQQMRSQQYLDSVKAATKQAEYEHEEKMLHLRNELKARQFNLFWNEDLWLLFVFAGGTITIVILCLRHSRRKAEDHKELINKLIDNNLLNSTEPISKEAIEALMKPKKIEKERFIGDATLLGLGIGLFVGAREIIHSGPEDFLGLAGVILIGLGLFRLIISTITTIIERRNAKRKLETKLMEEAVRKQTTDIVQEAEVIEEK